MNRLLGALLLLFLSAASQGLAADPLKESWYRLRSRANMEIGNYAAAIEAYEKYLELRPDDREALKGIALAHERQGETDKAIARFDIYLRHYPDDAEIAFKQAEYLSWSRYAYRKEDAVRYLKLGLAQRDDRAQRLKYARLLAADRYDLDGAVGEYEELLAQTPDDNAIRAEYRALLLWDDRYLDKAIAEFERQVERDPGHFDTRRQLAVLLSKSPRRLSDSAQLYAGLVAERPEDFELRRDYARVLARDKATFAEARAQYRQLLAGTGDYALLGEYAALLETRRDHRAEAIAVYTRMLDERRGDTAVRMRRAALYLARRDSAPQALRDYQAVIAAEPRNGRAHRGAAQALAWMDEPDRALYHSNLALTYGDDASATRSLHGELSKGREPRVSLVLEAPWQSGGDFKLRGFSLGAQGSMALSPFLTAAAGVGTERYEDDSDSASGGWYFVGGQYRLDQSHRVDVRLGKRGLRRLGSETELSVEYTVDGTDDSSQTYGLARAAVEESFQSLVGQPELGVGGATREAVYWFYRRNQAPYRLSLRPSLGRIRSEGESSNEYIDISGSIEMDAEFAMPAITGVGYQAGIATYSRDHSGFLPSDREPRSGGYFSPQAMIDQHLYAILQHRTDNDAEIAGRVGLRVQYVDDAAVSGEFSSGLTAALRYTRQSGPSRYLVLSAEHDAIADRYRRTLLKGEWVFVF